MEGIKLLVAGDFCVRYNQPELLDEKIQDEITKEIAQIAGMHDFSMLNVETAFSDVDSPIVKSGPPLRSNTEYLGFLKKFNFNIGACANNHMGDQGDDALLETIKHIQEIGMMTVGAGKNKEDAEKVLYIEKNGLKLGIINCAEHEFGIAEENKPGMAGLDYYDTSKIIKQAKEVADKVLVFIHGGNEENPLPRKGMKKICRFFAESGADVVIVGHAHCRQGYEIYNNVPIFYGLGNFFMQTKNYNFGWEHGYMVSLELSKENGVKYEIIPYRQAYDGSFFEVQKDEDKEKSLKYIDHISQIMQTKELYTNLTVAWSVYYMSQVIDWFKFDGRPWDDFNTLFVRNGFTCESHNELYTTYFKAYCEQKTDAMAPYIEMIKKLQNGEILDVEMV